MKPVRVMPRFRCDFCFLCRNKSGEWIPAIRDDPWLIFEVIGNIYENPDLLEGGE